MNTYFYLIALNTETLEIWECAHLAKTADEAMDYLYRYLCEIYHSALPWEIRITDRIGFDDPLAPLVLKTWGVEPQYESYTWDIPMPE
jgi:hypothetical protein